MKWLLSLLALVILLLVIAVVALANAPASLVNTALVEADKRGLLQKGAPQLALSGLSGTVWEGQAEDAIVTINGSQIALGQLSWQLDAMTLLKKQLQLSLLAKTDDQQVQAQLHADQQGVIMLSAVEGYFPIKFLEPWLPLLVSGNVSFVIDQLKFQQQQLLAIDGVMNIEDVDWLGGDRTMLLGSYLAQIYFEQQQIKIELNDFSANLGLDGMMTINPNGSYQFNAILQPRVSLAPEVAQSVAWLGRRQPNGDVLINTQGRF
ncbi:MAG: hypothetical protein ACJAYG_001778 [Oceanicoccus sp.]|jgi:hypothetical protein